MIYQINVDNFKFSAKTQKYLDLSVKRLQRYLTDFAHDLPLLRIYIQCHEKRDFFDGSMSLFLPGITLNSHFKSSSVDQALKLGFNKLKREIRDFKGKHFENYNQRNLLEVEKIS